MLRHRPTLFIPPQSPCFQVVPPAPPSRNRRKSTSHRHPPPSTPRPTRRSSIPTPPSPPSSPPPARTPFEKRDLIYAYNLELRTLSQRRDLAGSLAILDRMQSQGLRPDVYSYATALTCARRARSPSAALSLYARMRADRVRPDEHVLAAVLGAAARTQPPQLDLCRQLFATARRPGRVLCNVFLDALGRAGEIHDVRAVRRYMTMRGIAPDAYTASATVGALVNAGRVQEARVEIEHMRQAGAEVPAAAFNAVMAAYGRMGRREEVECVWREMCAGGVMPTQVSYNIFIAAYGQGGKADMDGAFELFEDMLGRSPYVGDRYTFHALMKVCIAARAPDVAVRVYEVLKRTKFCPNQVSYRMALQAAGMQLDRGAVARVERDMRRNGCVPGAETSGMLVAAAVWCGALDAALEYAQRFVDRVDDGKREQFFRFVERDLVAFEQGDAECAERVVPQLRKFCNGGQDVGVEFVMTEVAR